MAAAGVPPALGFGVRVEVVATTGMLPPLPLSATLLAADVAALLCPPKEASAAAAIAAAAEGIAAADGAEADRAARGGAGGGADVEVPPLPLSEALEVLLGKLQVRRGGEL